MISNTRKLNQLFRKIFKISYINNLELMGGNGKDEIDKMVYLHWIVIFTCLWYYAFFINQK